MLAGRSAEVGGWMGCPMIEMREVMREIPGRGSPSNHSDVLAPSRRHPSKLEAALLGRSALSYRFMTVRPNARPESN